MDVKIVYSNRKTVSLIVKNGSLTVRAPLGLNEKRILEIVKKHESWISEKLKESAVKEASHKELTNEEIKSLKKKAKEYFTAKTEEIAKIVAKSVVCSSLLKAAMFGADANWGRVLCAIGYSGADVDVQKVDVSFRSNKGEICVCVDGAGVAFSEEKAKEILLESEIEILISLKSGAYNATAWGCDLTYDYVKINGDYRT